MGLLKGRERANMMLHTRASAILWTGTTAIALALGSLACGGDDTSAPTATPAAEATPDAPAAANPNRPVPVTKKPDAPIQAEFVEGELPTSYPTDIPSYPGAEPKTSMSVPGQGTLATFSSSSSAEEILDFYRSELESRGWNVTDAKRGGINATKDGRAAQIKVLRSDGQSEIAVNIFGG